MKKVITVLVMMTGCATGPDRPAIEEAVSAYGGEAERAERTKTHASGEHPMALREMERRESQLRAACATKSGREETRRVIGRHLDDVQSSETRKRALQELIIRLGL